MIIQGKVIDTRHFFRPIEENFDLECESAYKFLFKEDGGNTLLLKTYCSDVYFEPQQWVNNKITLEINKNNTVIEFWRQRKVRG